MSISPQTLPGLTPSAPTSDRARRIISGVVVTLTGVMLAGVFFLISPPKGIQFPGAMPWQPGSLLKPITDAMSLGGLLESTRGIEIKDIWFQWATVAALLLLAGRAWVSGFLPAGRATARGPWFLAQGCLLAWVVFSALSALWAGDPSLALAQATLFAIGIGWAIALAWTLELRDLGRLLAVYIVLAAITAGLCVWYFHERNPSHRPGFPIGNPSTLAACILPAITLCAGVLFGEVVAWRTGGAVDRLRCAGAAAAFIPLSWCLLLTSSRGALVGVMLATATALYLNSNRRIRTVLVIAGIALVLTGGYYFTRVSANDLAMARGATIRFRLYAWRYAAELWATRTISGHGAGQFPRLAGPLALSDRHLDPGAFLGENIEHAHNELFEVLSEIGLVGGLTFVMGYVASFAAVFALLRTPLSPQRRWLLTGLVAGAAGLVADAMFGVGLRMPGVPAVFYTMLGAVWAACRVMARERGKPRPPSAQAARLRRLGVALGAISVAAVIAIAATQNVIGTVTEARAARARLAGDFETALANGQVAAESLLEPFRRLVARRFIVEDLYSLAEARMRRWLETPPPTGSAPASQAFADRLAEARNAAQEAARAAEAFEAHAPTFGRTSELLARSYELLAWLELPEAALRGNWPAVLETTWAARAWSAWLTRFQQRPSDYDTLMALLRYPGSPADRVILLRNALRSGLPQPGWVAQLEQDLTNENFVREAGVLAAAVNSLTPESNVDVLVADYTPEMLRLTGYRAMSATDFGSAARFFARAAQMYEPMRPRFPELQSVALAEQADAVLLATPDEPGRAVELCEAALAALPRIQEQKLEELARPFRLRLARALTAAGQIRAARAALLQVLGDEEAAQLALADAHVDLALLFLDQPGQAQRAKAWLGQALEMNGRHPVAWRLAMTLAARDEGAAGLQRAVDAAVRAGVSQDELRALLRVICKEHPAACQ